MKNLLCAILISPDPESRRKILSGEKTCTIRKGTRNYKSGTAMLCCHVEPWAVMADITGICFCNLSNVAEKDFKSTGFDSQEEMLEGMRKFYPDINSESDVTVVRWENVRGKLVDDFRNPPRLDPCD